jgi:hypothetical protein
MPKIIYRPFDRLDPMLKEAPTRYSPRPLLKSERAQPMPDKKGDIRQPKTPDPGNEANATKS